MSQLAEDLRAARAKITDRAHWIKGSLHHLGAKGEHLYCAVGATEVTGVPWKRVRPMQYALRSALPYEGSGTMAFNDSPRTTHADVLKLFDKAICEAEQADG